MVKDGGLNFQFGRRWERCVGAWKRMAVLLYGDVGCLGLIWEGWDGIAGFCIMQRLLCL